MERHIGKRLNIPCGVISSPVHIQNFPLGYDPQMGARPLKRLIQKEIINQLSKRILAGDIDKSISVLVDVFDGNVVFRNEIPSDRKVEKSVS